MARLQAAGIPTELVARRATEAYLMQVRCCQSSKKERVLLVIARWSSHQMV
jgi:hypothetical protein